MIIQTLLDLFLHLDKNMGAVIQSYGMWTYLILFAIIFAETGFVVTPFLPGDSLLFMAGAFAASGSLSLPVVVIILSAAAIIGDTLNYQIGHFIGPSVFKKDNARFLNKEHLKQTEEFYLKHGGQDGHNRQIYSGYSYLCALCGRDRRHELLWVSGV